MIVQLFGCKCQCSVNSVILINVVMIDYSRRLC